MLRSIFCSQNLFIAFNQNSRAIATTSICFAEPLKKKKVINPLATRKQYERKLRRYEREIAKLESAEPKLKPIVELLISPHVKREKDARIRKETDIVSEKLLKSYLRIWSIYKSFESKIELNYIRSSVQAQNKALEVLSNDYHDLYMEAIKLDPDLIPFKIENPKKETPPILNYNCPDGNALDITKEWKL